jgi:hypothetical protein
MAALLSEDDTDSRMTEPEPPSQQSVGTSTSQGASSIPTLTPPSSQEQSDWENLLEAETWMRDVPNRVMEEELFQTPLVPYMSDRALLWLALEWRKL